MQELDRFFVLIKIPSRFVSVKFKEVIGALFGIAESKRVRTDPNNGRCRKTAATRVGAALPVGNCIEE
jgi:hypothetical protein